MSEKLPRAESKRPSNLERPQDRKVTEEQARKVGKIALKDNGKK